mmetsp:Transcript_17818/g.24732  ORF Transcript_17818/g.24732 Transcript_17818/m.24732 type:complete len:122 (-) Transcript_17818:212-577(-)
MADNVEQARDPSAESPPAAETAVGTDTPKSENWQDKLKESAKKSATTISMKAKEVNEKHKIAEKVGAAKEKTSEKLKELNEKHQVSTKARQGIQKTSDWVGTSIRKLQGKDGAPPAAAPPS